MNGVQNAVGVGVVGCGNISSIYLENAKRLKSLNLLACADLDMSRAESRAAQFGISAVSVDAMLADPSIELIINLTIPAAHAEVARKALQAGKHVYNEKPLAVSRDDAKDLVELAHQRSLLLGGAPDTFLGGGLQTCRKLIDDGWIGTPVAATAFMLCHGHESWHPDPAFYYKRGGGPMLDMGPYYLSALVSLIGPVRRVTGAARITFPERTITSAPQYGATIGVEVPTHVAGILEFATGAIATLVTSFDVWAANVPTIEIYGTEGSLGVPDPNTYGGPVSLRRAGSAGWSEIPLTHGYTTNSRGIGVADMADALRRGRPHRASGDLTYHVLDIMTSIDDAARTGSHVELTSMCLRPSALPSGLDGEI